MSIGAPSSLHFLRRLLLVVTAACVQKLVRLHHQVVAGVVGELENEKKLKRRCI
jgi:hypothetical protein